MANSAITSDASKVTDARLVAIERDIKWQSLFIKLAFTAMIAVGIGCIVVTTVVILQLSDLNVGLARLTDRVDGLEDRFDGLEDKFDRLEDKFDRRFDGLEDKFDRRFDGLEDRFDGLEELVLQHIALHSENRDNR